MKSGKIAVTGADGFLGKRVCARLLEEGYKVAYLTRENCDITNPEQVKKALSGARGVIHLAARLDEEARDIYEVNVKGTENVLEACAHNSVGKIVFASTCGVYGISPGIKTEETEPAPETIYEKSKLEAEKKVLSYQEVLEVSIVRLAIVLGKNKYWERIISTVKKGFPLIGNGKNKWQVISDEDAAAALVFCLENPECSGEIFIAAEKDGLRLEELVAIIRESLGMEEPVRKIPLLLGMIIAHANAVLHFNPILRPAYVKRMQAQRDYSTKKLEALGWMAKHSAKEHLPKIVKEIRDGEFKAEKE